MLCKTLSLSEQTQQFEFNGLTGQPVVSFLRDFSAPVKVEFAQTNAELAHLIQHDNNGFARWEAMQRLCLNLMLPAIRGGELDPEMYQQLLNALTGLIDQPPQDKAILAEMLKLPAASYVAEQCHPIESQKVYATRKTLEHQLALDLESHFTGLYSRNHQDETFSLSPEAMAERVLKNTALGYLVATEKAEHYKLAEAQYRSATNMTDRLAAFGALVHSEYPDKQAIIDDFYAHWRDDTLVLDKWFAMQATVPAKTTLRSVEALLKHSAFSIRNPNKVRSLIGAYTGNMPGFHLSDGSGYKFVADKIIELNAINPQIAARLAGTFNNWKAHAEPYSSLMREQLERINAEPDLKKDIREIVSKALA